MWKKTQDPPFNPIKKGYRISWTNTFTTITQKNI